MSRSRHHRRNLHRMETRNSRRSRRCSLVWERLGSQSHQKLAVLGLQAWCQTHRTLSAPHQVVVWAELLAGLQMQRPAGVSLTPVEASAVAQGQMPQM